MNEIKSLQSLSLNNRIAYQNRQLQVARRSDRAQETTAKILGYDPSTGLFRVKDGVGRINYASAISNSGALSIGSQVSLVIPANGNPIIDAMPR